MDVGSPDSAGEALVRRACDQCRSRKIRCDKRTPCSNCRSSKIICRSTGLGQKAREPRKRVLISNEYEKKIDLIEERLGGIEQVLREMKNSLATNGAGSTFSNATPISNLMSPSAPTYSSNTTAAMDQQESKHAFDGNSFMAAQSAYASNFLETAVSRNALQISASKISTALSTLKQLVNMQDNQASSSTRESRFPNQKISCISSLKDLKMPPVDVVLPMLRRAKEGVSLSMQIFCPIMSIDRLIEKCREVYFATDDISDATSIVVNGGLYQLFVSHSFMIEDREMQRQYQQYGDLCRNNIELALANLRLLMPANVESIEALSMGAIHAIEISKPSFALTLTSTASRLCQALGYHQASSMEHDSMQEKEQKLRLFWTVYCLDRALSMRLGRAATIPDYDISLPSKFQGYTIVEPWDTAYMLWVQLAKIQGNVYEMLYSPGALRQSENERVSRARHLASMMQTTVMEPFERMQEGLGKLSVIEDLYMKSDAVFRLSVLTLIYRAIPPHEGSPGTFVDECIETARAALEVHRGCMMMLKESNETMKASYLHWSILFAPFVPFIVLFCHIIEVSSWQDLNQLDEFVASLEPNCSLSEAIAKLHRLCQVLSNVARLYIEAKTQAQTEENQTLVSVGQEFDTYLSALGLAPASVDDGDTRWTSAGPIPGTSGPHPGEPKYGIEVQNMVSGPAIPHMTQLGNWFSGNQYMMGLLEEDLSLFDPSASMQ